MPLQNLTLKVNCANSTNSYKVDFPKIGNFIDVEVRKTELTHDSYLGMLKSNTIFAYCALDLVDMISWYETLIPQLMKDLKVNSILDLGIIDAKSLLDSYREQFSPWIKEWLDILQNVKEEVREKDVSAEASK